MKRLQIPLLLGALLAIVSCQEKESEIAINPSPTLEATSFGTTADGQDVQLFTLSNHKGVEAKITEYGAILISLKVPDREGSSEEITLGYGDDLAAWEKSTGYFGATVGRYGNRIAEGKFSIGSTEYLLATNDHSGGIPCHLHGGIKGFDQVVWTGETMETPEAVGVKLKYRSVNGEEGYPGNLDVSVTYWLTREGELSFQVEATTDAPTPVNIINHTYWNLTGDFEQTILEHELQLMADEYLPINRGLIPTGEYLSVEETPMDFTRPVVIGSRINDDYEDLKIAQGYDHCWVLRQSAANDAVRTAAILHDPKSGRVMEMMTNQSGIQVYSGNHLNGEPSDYRTAICLETQCFPDSPNKSEFPDCILRPGETYRHSLVLRFSTK
ncbi:aldose epimerase family protein [Verrucomicrobiaceae bacterium 227]